MEPMYREAEIWGEESKSSLKHLKCATWLSNTQAWSTGRGWSLEPCFLLFMDLFWLSKLDIDLMI